MDNSNKIYSLNDESNTISFYQSDVGYEIELTIHEGGELMPIVGVIVPHDKDDEFTSIVGNITSNTISLRDSNKNTDLQISFSIGRDTTEICFEVEDYDYDGSRKIGPIYRVDIKKTQDNYEMLDRLVNYLKKIDVKESDIDESLVDSLEYKRKVRL